MTLNKLTEQHLNRLAEESEDSVAASLHYGVEIEFSDCDELGSGVSSCPYTDDDAVNSLESDATQTLVNYLPGGGDRVVYDIARQILANTDLENAIETCTRFSWSSVVQAELDSMIDNWEGDDSEGFLDVDGWEHCEDGTSGIVQEYKTDGPLCLTAIIERVNDLMNTAGSPTVPLNGSCHVHVSVPGAKHTASDKSLLHCCILYELSQFVPEFPTRLYKRLESSHQSYFSLDGLPTQKYSAVSFHHQGSVEFRLFGHLTDPDEINDCIRWAGLAFLRGYNRFRCGKYAVKDVAAFRTAFKTAVHAHRTMVLSDIQFDACTFIAEAVGTAFSDDADDGTFAQTMSEAFSQYVRRYRPIDPGYEWHNALVDSAMFRDAVEYPEKYEFMRRDGTIVVCSIRGGGLHRRLLDRETDYVFYTNVWGYSFNADLPDRNDLVLIRNRIPAACDVPDNASFPAFHHSDSQSTLEAIGVI
jgi:hypothetical protein